MKNALAVGGGEGRACGGKRSKSVRVREMVFARSSVEADGVLVRRMMDGRGSSIEGDRRAV